MNIEFYENTSGKSPVEDFLGHLLDKKAADKILWALELLEEQGQQLLKTLYLKKLKSYQLYELRILYRKKLFRVFIDIIDEQAWLLHIFQKETKHTPKKEIKIALQRKTILHKNLKI